MTAFELLCKIIASEVMGEDSLSDVDGQLDENLIKELYSVSKRFELCHLCYSPLKRIKPDIAPQLLAPFYNEFTVAVFRNRRFADELSQISELFEKEGVDHIALKGSVIRGYYPESWMRTSCDIDILVKKEELGLARALLEEKLGYKYVYECSHDVSFESQTGVHLELHFYLIEDYISLSAQSRALDGVWERSVLRDGCSHARAMTDADLYFYNLAHMAKHFLSGGCGIKPFIDLWVLENRVQFNAAEREKLVELGELNAFLDASKRLMSVWFFGNEYTSESRTFEKYLLHGGVYGTVENKVRVGVARKQGRLSYIISRIFPSYKTMRNMYPSLEKRKILLPIYHLRRWCRVLFCGGIKRARVQLVGGARLGEDEKKDISALLNSLGFLKKQD